MKPFHIVLVGYAVEKFVGLMSHVADECGFRVSFVVTTERDRKALGRCGVDESRIHHIDERGADRAPSAEDLDYLKRLERPDVPTIHNMIKSDSIVGKLPYDDALRYATHLAREMRLLFRALQPSVVIGGHDRMQASMGSAVARAEGIPWYALNFSVLPIGHVAVNPDIIPHRMTCLRSEPAPELYVVAAETLEQFETRRLKAPAYVSAYNLQKVSERFGEHLREAVQSASRGLRRFDRYNEYSFGFQARQYVRKRKNMLRLPKNWFLMEPPSEPFLFFGLHMQPESTPDVYAPLFSNQFDVVEKIARAMPQTHKLLVKLHISDADNYSRRQLRRFLQLPGVRLVWPSVSSRDFIDRCSAIVTICGTMGMEGALLGKPVIVFGKMNYDHFPSVKRVTDIFDLPKLLQEQIALPKPSRDAILDAFTEYLQGYFQATASGSTIRVDDWTTPITSSEKDGFVALFRALERFLAVRAQSATPVAVP